MRWIDRRRAFVLVVAVLGLGLAYRAWSGYRSHSADFAFQQRLSRWGGRSQPLPPIGSPLASLRKPLGDALYFSLVGSEGRVVGADRPNATREQLADLLTIQPIHHAYVAGMGAVDDDWVAGLRYRRAIQGLLLDGTGVTDRSCGAILEMRNLQVLSLADTAVSDDAVARLAGLPSLNQLQVGGPNIRAIRLVDHAVVDGQGRPATRSGETLSIRGHVAITWLSGAPGNVRIMVRTDGDRPARECVPYGWNTSRGDAGMLTEDSPGIWSFDVPISGIPDGQSSVEVWVDYCSGGRPNVIHYRLEPFSIGLTSPQSP